MEINSFQMLSLDSNSIYGKNRSYMWLRLIYKVQVSDWTRKTWGRVCVMGMPVNIKGLRQSWVIKHDGWVSVVVVTYSRGVK